MAAHTSSWLADRFELLRSDTVVAARAMRSRAGFALTVLVTLALTIGVNTAVFSVVRRLLLDPLPYGRAEQLYRLYAKPSTPDGDGATISGAEVAALTAGSKSIAGVALSGSYASITYTDGRIAEPWQMALVSPDFFHVLGVRPALGRDYAAEDFLASAQSVGIITYQIWQRTFGGDSAIIGRRVQLEQQDVTVIGVLPREWMGPSFTADVFRPLNMSVLQNNPQVARLRLWRVVVRVREGVTRDGLAAELAVLGARAQAQLPEIKNAGIARAAPLRDDMLGSAGPVVILAMAGAMLVLIAGCANIAGLLAARGTSRRGELAVRAALGADRERLVQQLLTESIVYAVLGGGAGLALAFALNHAIATALATTLPNIGDIRVDLPVLLFGAVISVACGVGFGIWPALSATRIDLRAALGDSGAGGRGLSSGALDARGTRILVAAQIALALTLIIGAGLLGRAFVRLATTDLGYQTRDDMLTFHVDLPPRRFDEPERRHALLQQIIESLHQLPGVTAAGYTAVAPWSGRWRQVPLTVENRAAESPQAPLVEYATASDEYFAAMGIKLEAGRTFRPTDTRDAPAVVVIGESLARRFWPGVSPIGARVRIGGRGADSMATREVVGVVRDVRESAFIEPVGRIYVSENQTIGFGGEFVVHATGDAARLIPTIRAKLHDVDSFLPLRDPRTVRSVMHESIARQQLAMMLLGVFSLLAVVLSGLGVYSITAHAVLARTREFGIRAALGARPSGILGLVLRQNLITTGGGLAAGLLLAGGTSRTLASLLSGVPAHDPLTFLAAAAILFVLVSAACLAAGRAALRVQPVDALRAE